MKDLWNGWHDLDPYVVVQVRAASWSGAVAAVAALLGRPVSDAQLMVERAATQRRAA